MRAELYLFILWERSRKHEGMFLRDLHQHFDIIQTLEIKWDKRHFSDNLSKFYGKKLPPNSHKEKEVGHGPFLLVIFWDKSPTYALRRVNSGDNLVNVNVFDTKEMYRSLVGGHNVHSSNTQKETIHDLKLLTGLEFDTIFKTIENGERITFYKTVL